MRFNWVNPNVADSRIFCLQKLLAFDGMAQQSFVSERVKVQVACCGANVGVLHVALVG